MIKEWVEKFHGLLSRLTSIVSAIACFLCALMVIHIFAEVLSRTVFDLTLPGTVLFVSNYYMIGITFIPLALVEHRNANVSVEVVTQLFSSALQRNIQVFGWLLSAAVFMLLAWASWHEALRQTKVGAYAMESGLQIILWPSYYLLPLGFFLVALLLVLKILARIIGAEQSRSEPSY